VADPVFTALAEALRGCDPAPAVVYEDPRQAQPVANVPCFILIQQTNTDHIWRTHSHGATQPAYAITAYLLLGSMQTPLPQLHAASVPSIWPRAVNAVLAADITLGGTVDAVGRGTEFFRYRVGPIKWGETLFWGIKFTIPIEEEEIDR
jgi:hypothetical protein